MEKINFNYLYSFKYKNKEYIYLYSKKYPFYFLEFDILNNKFVYPEINIFNELYKNFYLYNDIFNFNNNITKLSDIKNKLNKININIKPLIKTTSGLISIVIALSLCGCKVSNDNINNNVTATATTVQENNNQEIYEYFKKYNMDIIEKNYDNDNYIFIKKFINSNNQEETYIDSFDEFRKLKNINFIPTLTDVKNKFINNKNIDDNSKEIILKYLDNFQNNEYLKDMDLSVLYINAERMKIKYLTEEEITSNTKKSTYAYFDSTTATVYIPKDKPIKEFEFIHEVLGHGSLAYREIIDNKLFIFDCTNYIMIPTENRYIGYSIGIMISEGGANLIAHLLTNDYSIDNFYELYEEEIRVIAEFCNISIGELLNNKGTNLYDLMNKNNINTPIDYIFKMDAIYNGKMYCEFSDLMENLFIDATYEKFINADEITKNDIIKETVNIINNSYFKNKKELNFNYDGGSINYNFEEITNKYINDMENIKNKK